MFEKKRCLSVGNARNCESERRVLSLFAEQTVYGLLLELEQRAPLIKLSESLGEKKW